ncbi:beta-lactamase domain-containing protein 2-like protein [Tanacetum coccineum]
MDAVVASNNAKWVYESPINSDVEAKLRGFLVELGNDDKILGIQVCAYKDGQVIIDTAAGVLGKDDPRPIQHDSLFPLFSVTKGVTAGMVHWLADKGKLKLDENVANFWPEFGRNGKEQIK